MKRKNNIFTCSLLVIAMLLSSCGEIDKDSTCVEECENIYKTVVQETGENESTSKYLEIAERSAELILLLEENANAFVMDAYNYQTIDDDGTPLYEMNGLDYPVEIDPAGHYIRVSKNYFQFNPMETADGSNLVEQIIYDDFTLNVLVAEKYIDVEKQIIAAYKEQFYFEKVQATNAYIYRQSEQEKCCFITSFKVWYDIPNTYFEKSSNCLSSLQSKILARKKQSILKLTALKVIKLYCIENYFFDVPQSISINKAIPIPAIKKKILILFFFTNPTIPMIIRRIEIINEI